ncbi:MAG TPA: HAD-IIA family hydrolase [Candidatus Deferrimicrobium sp.]|nr:HAD-IIA family hydrolase [Candidatus Deferrimicrobium sp.]
MDLKDRHVFIFDLDGVIYLGGVIVPGARELLNLLNERNKIIYYVTNNSTRTRMKFCEKLLKMGIQAQTSQIITSAFATAQYLKQLAPKATVYIIGEEGLISEFTDAGFQIILEPHSRKSIEYVIVGLDRNFTYQKLAIALTALESGAKFIATNTDPTLPTEKGNLPGAGTMVSALSTAANSKPIFTIGKPNPFMLELILKKEGATPDKAVIIGDRYSTDIKAGLNANIGTILVKTGTGIQEIQLIPPTGPHPDLILESIASIRHYL